jgi:transposase-like protein
MIAFEEAIMSRRSRAHRWTPEQARVVLERIERRGISVKQFAERHGLGVERLYRWKRRLAQTDAPKLNPPRFTEVTVCPSGAAAAIEIELGSGVHLRVSGDSRVEDAVAILSRLPGR